NGNQQKITMLEYKIESAGWADRLLSHFSSSLIPGTFPAMNPICQDHAKHEQSSGDQQHGIRTQRFEQPTRYFRAQYRAKRTADSDDGKQALPLSLRIDVVGKCPELRHHHQIEQSYPQKKHHSQ